MTVHHFAYGWVTPVTAFTFSFLGCLLSLMLAIRARQKSGPGRIRLLVGSAVVLAGNGVWLTHFVAMLGFDVPDLVMRYELWRTVMSVLIALGVVVFGMLVVGVGRPSTSRYLIGGPVTGLGVAVMHYTGVAAIRVNGTLSYRSGLFSLSLAIAVVAATVALWLAMTVRTPLVTVLSAVAMAVAVCTMHYTGMAAVRVTSAVNAAPVEGIPPFTFLAPISIVASLLIVTLAYTMAGTALDERDADLATLVLVPADRGAQQRTFSDRTPAVLAAPGADRTISTYGGMTRFTKRN